MGFDDIVARSLCSASVIHIAFFNTINASCYDAVKTYRIFDERYQPLLDVIDNTDCPTRCLWSGAAQRLVCKDVQQRRYLIYLNRKYVCAVGNRMKVRQQNEKKTRHSEVVFCHFQVIYPAGRFIGDVIRKCECCVLDVTLHVRNRLGNTMYLATQTKEGFTISNFRGNRIGKIARTKNTRPTSGQFADHISAHFPSSLPLEHKVLMLSCALYSHIAERTLAIH